LIELDWETGVWRVSGSWKGTWVDLVDFPQKRSKPAEEGALAPMKSYTPLS
jgi:hypothetical protein